MIQSGHTRLLLYLNEAAGSVSLPQHKKLSHEKKKEKNAKKATQKSTRCKYRQKKKKGNKKTQRGPPPILCYTSYMYLYIYTYIRTCVYFEKSKNRRLVRSVWRIMLIRASSPVFIWSAYNIQSLCAPGAGRWLPGRVRKTPCCTPRCRTPRHPSGRPPR